MQLPLYRLAAYYLDQSSFPQEGLDPPFWIFDREKQIQVLEY